MKMTTCYQYDPEVLNEKEHFCLKWGLKLDAVRTVYVDDEPMAYAYQFSGTVRKCLRYWISCRKYAETRFGWPEKLSKRHYVK